MMYLDENDDVQGNEELEALELGHRVVGYIALTDLYPETAGVPIGSAWMRPRRTA